jgi:hypothetical protein
MEGDYMNEKEVKKQGRRVDLVSLMLEFESGDLDLAGTLELFSELIRTGKAWHLQGFYGRSANVLIRKGWIDEDGEILKTRPD